MVGFSRYDGERRLFAGCFFRRVRGKGWSPDTRCHPSCPAVEILHAAGRRLLQAHRWWIVDGLSRSLGDLASRTFRQFRQHLGPVQPLEDQQDRRDAATYDLDVLDAYDGPGRGVGDEVASSVAPAAPG